MAQEIETTADKVGNVSVSRYEELVALLREVVENQTRGQFTIGDAALEIEPMREPGGSGPADEMFSVKQCLARLAEDIGLSYSSIKDTRWVASRWPKDRRQPTLSFTVHRVLAGIADESERFAVILTPPPGRVKWTPDEARRKLGRQVEVPVTPQEKVSAIHALAKDEQVAAVVTGDFLRRPEVVAQVQPKDRVRVVEELTRDDQVAAAVAPSFLRRPEVVARVAPADKVRVVEELTRDDHVAAEVTTGLLRRPDVAARAMADDTARHQVNHAQVERGRQAREDFEQNSPVAPAVRQIDRTVEFLDLVTACHAFVAAAGRVVPGLRDRQLGEDEKAVIRENCARVKATLDWVETAVDTGKVDMDSELARLLQSE